MRRHKHPRICEQCDDTYYTASTTQRFCSRSCATKSQGTFNPLHDESFFECEAARKLTRYERWVKMQRQFNRRWHDAL